MIKLLFFFGRYFGKISLKAINYTMIIIFLYGNWFRRFFERDYSKIMGGFKEYINASFKDYTKKKKNYNNGLK